MQQSISATLKNLKSTFQSVLKLYSYTVVAENFVRRDNTYLAYCIAYRVFNSNE